MMTLTDHQYEVIRPLLPVQRGNVRIANLDVLNAVLYVAENGCKWRALPARFGKWHTIYTRLRRWAAAGVLDRVFQALQEQRLIRIRVECLGLDSTTPMGRVRSKKRPPSHRQVARRLEHQDSSGCRE
jgi:transposase